MTKTPGQVAFEKYYESSNYAHWHVRTIESQREWEATAAAVIAASKGDA